MAEICAVCDKKIGVFSLDKIQGVVIHDTCREAFFRNPEKYGGKAIKKTEAQIKAESQHAKQEQKIEEKSVHVKSFDMPFGDMVGFIFKWAMASIPTAIFLAILFAIFTAIFA